MHVSVLYMTWENAWMSPIIYVKLIYFQWSKELSTNYAALYSRYLMDLHPCTWKASFKLNKTMFILLDMISDWIQIFWKLNLLKAMRSVLLPKWHCIGTNYLLPLDSWTILIILKRTSKHTYFANRIGNILPNDHNSVFMILHYWLLPYCFYLL